MLVDLEGRFQYINRTEPGYHPAEVVGTPIYDFLEELDAANLRRCVDGVIATNHPGHCVLEYRHGNGHTLIFETRVSPVIQDGELVSLAMVGRNETDHYEVARSLLDREQRLRVLVEQLPAILWTTDDQLVFTSSQGAGLKAMGLRATRWWVCRSWSSWATVPNPTMR